ncbi:helix-turn-helix domain-containing protein [Paenarthrobacter sp. NPDC057981]|uniref:helix-turn-helix domain-containing protein n=1 Tax=Paenarthrobacter sp. NPDC057981 TaxID=3346297 RepID=UPI0036DFA0D6
MSALAPEARSDVAMQLGMRLREARQRAKLSLRELARRVNVSASLISQVERGRTSPSVGTLYALVSELDLSLDDVLRDGAALSLPSPASKANRIESDPRGPTSQDHVSFDGPRPLRGQSGPEVKLPGLLEAKDRPKLRVDGVLWERLTAENDPNLELVQVTYKSGTQSCPPNEMTRQDGHEYFHVLKGTLWVEAGATTGVVSAGDSINFSSAVPHRLSNPFPEDCSVIWIVIGRHS